MPDLSATVRPAVAADLPRVRSLEERWAAEGITPGLVPTGLDLLERALAECFFVAERGGEVIGFIFASVRSDERKRAVVPRGERYLEIEELYVAPGQRSGGVGAGLVDAAAAWARSRGVRFVTAYSATADVDRVLRFYRSRGFRSWSVEMVRDLGPPREDAGDGR